MYEEEICKIEKEVRKIEKEVYKKEREKKKEVYKHLIKDDGFPFSGRFFYSPNLNSDNKQEISITWQVPSKFKHIGIHINQEERVLSLSIAGPLGALWFGYSNWRIHRFLDNIIKPQLGLTYATDRKIDFSFHDNSLFWSIWKTDAGWNNKMPKWQSGSRRVRTRGLRDIVTKHVSWVTRYRRKVRLHGEDYPHTVCRFKDIRKKPIRR